MQEQEVIKTLQQDLNFSDNSIIKLKLFLKSLIDANKKHNFISKGTEKDVWHRHVLDSAQLVKFINFNKGSLADLGSGGGFPGIVIAIFNENRDFHVKLYEKSPVKRKFLNKIINNLKIDAEVYGNIYENNIEADFIVCRAFKKLEIIIQVSRETAKKSHKLIILKGKSAQEEINNSLIIKKYRYKLEKSLTSGESKIILVDVNK